MAVRARGLAVAWLAATARSQQTPLIDDVTCDRAVRGAACACETVLAALGRGRLGGAECFGGAESGGFGGWVEAGDGADGEA
jgi:hypothetical protein